MNYNKANILITNTKGIESGPPPSSFLCHLPVPSHHSRDVQQCGLWPKGFVTTWGLDWNAHSWSLSQTC